MALAVDQELGVRTFVVAISVFVIAGFTVNAFLLTVGDGTEPITLAIDRIERARRLHVVAELSGMTVRVRRGEISTDVSAHGSRVDWADERIAFAVYKVAGNAHFVVVTVVVFVTEVAVELFAFLRTVRSSSVIKISS